MKTLFFFSMNWNKYTSTQSLNSRNLKLLKLLKKLFFNQTGAVVYVVSRKAKIWKFKMLYFQTKDATAPKPRNNVQI